MEVYKLSILFQKQYNSLSAEAQEQFNSQFRKNKKSVLMSYFLFVLFGFHYAYLNNWGKQFLYIFTVGGMGLWIIADIFRIPSIVRDYNEEKALDIISKIKMIDS